MTRPERKLPATIKEVWASVGYNDGSNFAHDFKARFDMSPSDYRAQVSAPAAVPRELCPPDPDTPTKKPTVVMIVDDDVGMRETIGRHLRVSGFDVVSVATGVEGIRTAQGTSIDIGLIDYHLPDMDGIHCVRTLLEERRNQSLRLLLFTADWSVEERGSELRQLGVTVLSKLCDLHDIEAALRRTMAS